LRGPLQAGRAGGLLELTHRAASSLFSLRVWLICLGAFWAMLVARQTQSDCNFDETAFLKIAFRLHF